MNSYRLEATLSIAFLAAAAIGLGVMAHVLVKPDNPSPVTHEQIVGLGGVVPLDWWERK